MKWSPPLPCTGWLDGRSPSSGYSTWTDESVRAKEPSCSSFHLSSFRSGRLVEIGRRKEIVGTVRAAVETCEALNARADCRNSCDRNIMWSDYDEAPKGWVETENKSQIGGIAGQMEGLDTEMKIVVKMRSPFVVQDSRYIVTKLRRRMVKRQGNTQQAAVILRFYHDPQGPILRRFWRSSDPLTPLGHELKSIIRYSASSAFARFSFNSV